MKIVMILTIAVNEDLRFNDKPGPDTPEHAYQNIVRINEDLFTDDEQSNELSHIAKITKIGQLRRHTKDEF